jgi:hypothetical protein
MTVLSSLVYRTPARAVDFAVRGGKEAHLDLAALEVQQPTHRCGRMLSPIGICRNNRLI